MRSDRRLDEDALTRRGYLKVARCRGLAPREADTLVARCGGAAALARATRAQLQFAGCERECARRLVGSRLDGLVDREIELAEKHGWLIVHRDDPLYPTPLREISVPPFVLTVRGLTAPLGRAAVAIVGSRRPSSYGISMARDLAAGLAARGVVVVSGLARGIDAAAHRAALESGGTTIAVLGTGMDVTYPAEHRRLAEEMTVGGTLITEFPPGAAPHKHHFPRRNRIIAGLADVVVIVEAALPSGTMSTARWACDENRTVMAVPGRVGDPESAGCLALLRDGAAMAANLDDVVMEIAPDRRPSPLAGVGAVGEASDAGPVRRLDARLLHVLRQLPPRSDASIDEIAMRTEMRADELLAAIFELELAECVESVPGSRYRLTPRARELLDA